MRILFINTFDVGGGAAVVASRLSRVLHAQYESENYYLAGMIREQNSVAIPARGPIGTIVEKTIDKFSNLVGAQYFFFPFSSRTIVSTLKKLRPDIVSLHNTHGGYFQTDLLPHISTYAPIVWTLHDMWSFTGNAAHTFGNDSWTRLKNDNKLTAIYPSIGVNTGSWLLQRKQNIYKQSRLTVVTPSRWLQNLARQSPVFDRKDVMHIFNGLDLQVFKPLDKRKMREKLGIPDDAKVLMFSAEHLKDNFWKGGEDLRTLLLDLDRKASSTIYLLAVGQGELDFAPHFQNLCVKHTGFIKDEQTMVECYSAADLFLYPTRADNLPNVLVEAIACGVPCITVNVGGCTEIISDNENGLILNNVTDASRIVALLEDKSRLASMSANAIDVAKEKFSDRRMGDSYYTLFKSLVAGS